MAQFKRVKSTIPSRTWGGRKVQISEHAIYLKLGFLAQERRRRQVELDNLTARIILLQKRIGTVDAEMEKLRDSIVPAPISHIIEADPPPQARGLLIRY